MTHFDTLLRQAQAHPEPRQLLLVFAALAPGRAPRPVMCLDAQVNQIASFEALRLLADQHESGWQAVFVGSIPGGPDGQPLGPVETEAALDNLAAQLARGERAGMIGFDRLGSPLA